MNETLGEQGSFWYIRYVPTDEKYIIYHSFVSIGIPWAVHRRVDQKAGTFRGQKMCVPPSPRHATVERRCALLSHSAPRLEFPGSRSKGNAFLLRQEGRTQGFCSDVTAYSAGALSDKGAPHGSAKFRVAP